MNTKLTSNKKVFGTICGVLAAMFYGTNPLGALKLYEQGMNTNSVLFSRFSMAWIIISIILIIKKESLKVNRREFGVLTALGLLFTASSMTLYFSFHYIAAGVASTLLFTYPIMTAVIMGMFFKEKAGFKTIVAIILSLVGVLLLYWSDAGGALDTLGVILVLVSALTYSIYIIVVNRCPLEMSSFKINFYVVLYCAIGMAVFAWITGQPLQLPHNAVSWFYASWLAVVPATLSLVLMVYASKYVGATPTAILGALEPLTAVLIGIFVFDEPFGFRLAMGIVLILGAVIITAYQSKKKPEI
ncbi:MAG: EamA family transporter [Bacteroidales bacterium]|nr:EamA family transporter [Bacteroidales bacterium]